MAVGAEAVSVVASVDGLSTVTVTAWNGTLNVTNGTELLSAVHGVHVTSDEELEAVDVDDDGLSLSIDIVADGDDDSEALRKSVSCRYYDETRGVWGGRGVVLPGLDVGVGGGNVVVSVSCASSHLTLFTISDESETAKLVEQKVLALADRVAALNHVDLFGGDTKINWLIFGVFGGDTGVCSDGAGGQTAREGKGCRWWPTSVCAAREAESAAGDGRWRVRSSVAAVDWIWGRGEAAGAGSAHDECFLGTAVQLGPRGGGVWTR